MAKARGAYNVDPLGYKQPKPSKPKVKDQQRTWADLILGVRVEGDTVVITVKDGNHAARELCGKLINEMEKNT